MKKAFFVSLVAVFASFNVVCDSLMGLPELSSGVWYSWIFISEPLTGIILGPYGGFLSTLIGVIIGNFVYFRGHYEFLFTMGAPIGTLISGLLFRKRWKPVFTYYTLLFAAFFATPVAWQLPVWGMWDTYLAYAILLATALLLKRISWGSGQKGLVYSIIACTFIGLEADVLFRIFVFVPGQTYSLFYGYTAETLRGIWTLGAIETPAKVAICCFFTAIVGPQIVKAVRRIGKSQFT